MPVSTGKKLLLGLLFLSIAFVLLRLRTVGHLLMWDEAWNILSLRAYINDAQGDPFYWYYRFHPPLYMFFAELLLPFRHGFDIRAELLSLFFSYCAFVVTYLLSARIGGWKLAWLTGIFLCFMPASTGYDTWIKRDGLAAALGYLAVFFVYRKKYFWCAAALSLSLLSKESGFFFLIAAVILILASDEEKKIRSLLFICAVIFAAVSWWYIPLSRLTKNLSDFYFSGKIYGAMWSASPFYYLKKMIPDLGVPMLFFFSAGFLYAFFLIIKKKQKKWLIPLSVLVPVYLIISTLFSTKTPWLSFSAGPASAIIAGGGALFLIKKAEKIRALAVLVPVLLLLHVYTGISFSYSGYHKRTYPNGWPGADSSRSLAYFLNDNMKKDASLMIAPFAYWKMPVCPVFLFYWEARPVTLIKGDEKAEEILGYIKNKGISWFVIPDSPDPEYNFHILADEITKLSGTAPRKAGWSLIWNFEEQQAS
ncbi:MAG: hypothetical protein ABH883_09355 [Candidatus Omnitrophota bacterium]